MPDPICDGRGDFGDHCCYFEGQVCNYLDTNGTNPRCKLWGKMSGPRWERSLAGKWFAERFPGYTCEDWPQNIPELQGKSGPGLCCWKDGV